MEIQSSTAKATAHVVLTGASQGIGNAILRALARGGHHVITLSRTEPEQTKKPEKSIGKERVAWKPLDLSNADVVEQCVSSLEPINIHALVLSAVDYGSSGRHPASTTSAGEWQKVIATNCLGQCILASRLLPKLVSHSPGIIVNISSDVALLPGPGRVAYAASKAGLHAALRTIAQEHSHDCLRVFQLVPTFQMVTEGIRRRRPANFDFSSYGAPDILGELVNRILSFSGESFAPATYLVHQDGTIDEYSEAIHL